MPAQALSTNLEARVIQYALAKGRNWKSSLAREWHNGSDERDPLLRQLRNDYGTKWLMNYKLPKEVNFDGKN